MGVYMSCLLRSHDDEENETASLLRNQQNTYNTNYAQEEQLLKQQQQRQQELSNIVNELSDKLIDVTSFLNPSSSATNLQQHPSLSSLTPHNVPSQDYEHVENDNGIPTSNKTYPYVYTTEDRDRVLKEMEQIDETIRESCKVQLSEPLYLKF